MKTYTHLRQYFATYEVSAGNTGCISELGDFATLFFLVRQHWGRCHYCHFAASFKVF